jgi:hypothetical protein
MLKRERKKINKKWKETKIKNRKKQSWTQADCFINLKIAGFSG